MSARLTISEACPDCGGTKVTTEGGCLRCDALGKIHERTVDATELLDALKAFKTDWGPTSTSTAGAVSLTRLLAAIEKAGIV